MRLAAQQLQAASMPGIATLVSYMGAVQAQDFAMSKWAIGSRLNEATRLDVDNALASGSIIRTHILRPTWHIVAATDIMWMLNLTAPNILRITGGYHKSVELTPKILQQGATILRKSLDGGIELSREEIRMVLKKGKINTDENRLSHVLMDAELKGLICSGSVDGNGQKYKLIPDEIKQSGNIQREEAIQRLAACYFKSHGPATIHDFNWWSALSIKDCRIGVDLNAAILSSYDDDGTTYYFDEVACSFSETGKQHHLLAAYDEFFIGYKDRSACIEVKHNSRLFSNNGIFSPSLITNGRASGSWKRKIDNKKVTIDIQLFTSPSNISMRNLRGQAARVGKFLGKEVELRMNKE